MSILRHQTIVSLVNWRKLSIKYAYCPVCGCRRPIVRLDENAIAVRCLWCRSTPLHMSIVSILRSRVSDLGMMEVYELSARGPLFHFLTKKAAKLTCSEYFDNVASGEFKKGIQCQDVQCLTYPDEVFDICTSTEVFEHVPDDMKGFSEIYRVLKPMGILVFTVPLRTEYETVERARPLLNGEIQHLCSQEYHGDPLRNKAVLAFRNYGRDIVNRLLSCGFVDAAIVMPPDDIPWGYARPVVVAHRGSLSNKSLKRPRQ
jgi:SAM-dependent methyltransferase